MGEPVVHKGSAVEYFRDLVNDAMRHQRVEAGELTSWYVVQLLTRFARPTFGDASEPLGMRLAKALQAGGTAQRDALRRVGDDSLFISGFFADSLARTPVDLDYYIALGECAYGHLARVTDARLREVFDELAEQFGAFVDVLGEVSERSALSSNADLLRLYERWLRTGSRRSGELLARRGILPVSPLPGSRSVQ